MGVGDATSRDAAEAIEQYESEREEIATFVYPFWQEH